MNIDSRFFRDFDIDLSKVGTLENKLQSDGVKIEIYNDILSIIEITQSYQNKLISTYHPSIFKLAIFLNQYKSNSKLLPTEISSKDCLTKLGYTNLEQYYYVLHVIRSADIDSYQDCIDTIHNIHNQIDLSTKLKATYFGDSLENWYFGDKHGYSASKFKLSNGFWTLVNIERNLEDLSIIFYSEDYVYLYILLLYVSVF